MSDYVIIRLLNNNCAWIITEKGEMEVSRSFGESAILAARKMYANEYWNVLEHNVQQYTFN